MKRKICIFLAVVLVLGLILSAGCGQTGQQGKGQKQGDIYKVAVAGDFPPFAMLGKDGQVQGFEIDLINAIAEAGGFGIECQISSWEANMPSLRTKRVDVLLASMTITEERKKEVDFSDPYFESTNYMLVPVDSTVRTLADLRGKSVSVLQASTSDFAVSDYLGKDYEGIRRFQSTTAAFLELRNSKVDASVGDSGIVMYYLKSNPEAKLKVIKDSTFPKEYYGMAVRKGETEVLQKINAGLSKIRENGKYQEIYQKWFNS